MKWKPSLFGRYWLTLAGVATVPIVIAGFMEGWFSYWATYQATLERQVLEARQAAYLIDSSVRPPVERLRHIAGLPWNHPSSTQAEWTAEMMRLTRNHELIERVSRYAPDGSLIAEYPESDTRLPLARVQALVARALPVPSKGMPPVVSIRGEPPRAWSIVLTERGSGNCIVADLRMTHVNDLVRVSAGSPSRLVFVSDRANVIVAHPGVGTNYAGMALADVPGWKRVENSVARFESKRVPEGSIGDTHLEISSDPRHGNEWFVAWRRLDDLDWYVFALAPSEGLRSQLYAGVLRTAIILVAANALALLIALALARHLSRPLESLSEASQRVAGGDLTARATISSDDDIGDLSRQFNSMVEQLDQSYADLERRVEEKTAELALANRHKSEFLAQMSHELRTPLSAIINYALRLKDGEVGPLTAMQTRYSSQIHASGRHLLALINGLLDLAKIEAGRMDLDLANVDVRRLIDSALILVKGRADEKGVRLTDRIDPGLTVCVADELKLTQILVNLVSNAVKFTPNGGAAEIAIERVDSVRRGGDAFGEADPRNEFVRIPAEALSEYASGTLIAVSDTGRGIAPEQLSRLFKDFGQLRSPGEEPVEGTGLGLAVSQRLAMLHQAQIRVASVEGRGSTFWFVLPDREWPAN